MTPVQHSILVRFGQFPRNLNFFTTSVNGYTAMAPAVAQRNLDALQEQGLIVQTQTGYRLTAKGRARMDGPGAAAPPAERRADYVQPKWEPARGAPAEQHRQYKSLPVSPQIDVVPVAVI